MKSNHRYIVVLLLVLALGSLAYCVYRDVQIEKHFTSDLHNRIIGSRLQKDGISPYFYHWKKTDPIRYYDPTNYYNMRVSNVTATPFFHQLLYPLVGLPHRSFSRMWLAVEYLAVLLTTLMALSFCRSARQRWIVLFTSLIFLYTYAWKGNVEMGQLYVLVPVLAMLFFYLISRRQSTSNAVFAGVLAMSLLLIRPNTALFFLPFLFIVRQFSRSYLLKLAGSAILVFLLAFAGHRSRQYWSDYREAMIEHVKYHQYLSPTLEDHEVPALRPDWEGWRIEQIEADKKAFPFKHNGENGNLFVVIQSAFHYKIPLWLLTTTCLVLVLTLLAIFFRRHHGKAVLPLHMIALLGFCLYMTSDILSPIHRFQYNASQWLFCILLLAAFYNNSFKKIFSLMLLFGLILNGLVTRIIPMQSTLGEYLVFAAVLGLLFTMKEGERQHHRKLSEP